MFRNIIVFLKLMVSVGLGLMFIFLIWKELDRVTSKPFLLAPKDLSKRAMSQK